MEQSIYHSLYTPLFYQMCQPFNNRLCLAFYRILTHRLCLNCNFLSHEIGLGIYLENLFLFGLNKAFLHFLRLSLRETFVQFFGFSLHSIAPNTFRFSLERIISLTNLISLLLRLFHLWSRTFHEVVLEEISISHQID